ncbi:hypothetical protein LTS14_002686 [Recurvomyces mirabilis]|uniref:uncharacterized protein n=1 Tax=Recurvomyces mirabilis TaxID=574656 RepID=UPI002DDE7EAA|nr:hypothetical protein LTS14_002686 [Recurvomyces mirabilis]
MSQLQSWAKERERKRRARGEDQEESSGPDPDSKRRGTLISSSTETLGECKDGGVEEREEQVEPGREDASNTIFPLASDADSSATFSPSHSPPSAPPHLSSHPGPYPCYLAAAHHPLPSKSKRHTHRVNILIYDPRITATAIIYIPTRLALSIPFTQAMERDAGGECEFVTIRSRSHCRGWYICSLLAEFRIDGVGEIQVTGRAKGRGDDDDVVLGGGDEDEDEDEDHGGLGVVEATGIDSSTTLVNDDGEGSTPARPSAATAESSDDVDATSLPSSPQHPHPPLHPHLSGPRRFTRHPRGHHCSTRLQTDPEVVQVAEIRQFYRCGRGGKAHLRLRFWDPRGEEVVLSGLAPRVGSRVVVGDVPVVFKGVG